MSIQRRLTLVNAGSYGDIFGVCEVFQKYHHKHSLFAWDILSLFPFGIFIIYVRYCYSADSWFLLK